MTESNNFNVDVNITSNIPNPGFAAGNIQWYNDRKQVQFKTAAEFQLGDFSIIQLIEGYKLVAQYSPGSISKEHANLLAKLALYKVVGTRVELNHLELPVQVPTHLELDRKEVQILREWLEARMQHCEGERDERATIHDTVGVKVKGRIDIDNPGSPVQPVDDSILKFNPDTYIAMKFLLLDIREWLVGDIID